MAQDGVGFHADPGRPAAIEELEEPIGRRAPAVGQHRQGFAGFHREAELAALLQVLLNVLLPEKTHLLSGEKKTRVVVAELPQSTAR